MVTISNERLEVKINLHGGSLTSIFDKQRKMEMQYQPDPRAWKGQDVVIFPFVARLKDKTFTYKGKEYSLDNHGLARYNDFDVVYQKDNEVTLLFKSTKETLKKYPFEFKLFVNYKVVDEVLFVKYSVKSNGDIYYGLGGHPALRIPAVENEDCLDTSGNRVVLDKEYDLYYYSMDSNYEFVDRKKHFGKASTFEVTKEFFKEWNTLILDAKDIHNVKLVRKDGIEIKYHFDKINYLTLWSHQQYGDYVCVEPWMSLPDFLEGNKDISKKETLLNQDSELSYSITF